MNWILVFIGGGLGSLSRYFISVKLPYQGGIPWATLLSNLLASAVLGVILLVGKTDQKPEWLIPFLGIGFCGGFSTFSTFSAESIQLLQQGNYLLFGLNLGLSLLGCLGVLYLLSFPFK
ncbi:MAG: fluoride efflux transporter FluC [Flavobacteriales bacterium]